jgi:RecB family endonuclease NucS
LNLSNPEREQSAGAFNIDIVAEDEAGNPVIIENQLEKSDHDHLGKVIIYLLAMGQRRQYGLSQILDLSISQP